jgi:hypothetical protein
MAINPLKGAAASQQALEIIFPLEILLFLLTAACQQKYFQRKHWI